MQHRVVTLLTGRLKNVSRPARNSDDRIAGKDTGCDSLSLDREGEFLEMTHLV